MDRVTYDILEEPSGEAYRQLIDFATPFCETALLVVKHIMPLAESGDRLLGELAPFLSDERESLEWPGTKMLEDPQLVLRYRLGLESAAILKQAVVSLYGWRQPNLPEDLCLLRGDGEPWLVTIAHERDGYLLLSLDELRALFHVLPVLRSMVKEHTDAPPQHTE